MKFIVKVMKDFGSRLQAIGLLPTLLAVGVVAFPIAAEALENVLSRPSIKSAVESIGLAGAFVIAAVSVAVAVSLQPL